MSGESEKTLRDTFEEAKVRRYLFSGYDLTYAEAYRTKPAIY